MVESPVPPELTLLRNQPHASQPFILQLPAPSAAARQTLAASHILTFGLLLLGKAITLLPHIVRAVRLMARRGLGAERTDFELIAVEQSVRLMPVSVWRRRVALCAAS